jgi:tetratricopeptide (TPR) repeat protein
MIFELGKQPPAQLAKQLRQVIKESAGLALQVETRFVTDLVEDEQRGDEGQQDPTPTSKPPSPQEDAARLMARLKEVVAAVQKVAAANNPNAQAAKAAVAGLNELIKAKKYDEANAAIDKALGLLAQTGASSGEISPEALAQWQEALQAWQQASDAVDGQIAKLQAALKATADEDFVEIADKGLNALTGNYRVRLMVILREAQSSQGPAFKKLAGKGAALAKGFRDHLDSDERVEACDDNPFGVSVSIRPTLGAALAKLAGAFDAVSKA